MKDILDDAYVSGKKPIDIAYGGKTIKLYVNEIGFLAHQAIVVRADREGKNALSMIIAECVISPS